MALAKDPRQPAGQRVYAHLPRHHRPANLPGSQDQGRGARKTTWKSSAWARAAVGGPWFSRAAQVHRPQLQGGKTRTIAGRARRQRRHLRHRRHLPQTGRRHGRDEIRYAAPPAYWHRQGHRSDGAADQRRRPHPDHREHARRQRPAKPGDIVTSMSGQTIGCSTPTPKAGPDLCDAPTYAERFRSGRGHRRRHPPTGAIIALGNLTSGLLANDDDLAAELLASGQAAGDKAWQLPCGRIPGHAQRQPPTSPTSAAGAPARSPPRCFLAPLHQTYKWAHWTSPARPGNPAPTRRHRPSGAAAHQFLIGRSLPASKPLDRRPLLPQRPDRLPAWPACSRPTRAAAERRCRSSAPDGNIARHFDQMLWNFQPSAFVAPRAGQFAAGSRNPHDHRQPPFDPAQDDAPHQPRRRPTDGFGSESLVEVVGPGSPSDRPPAGASGATGNRAMPSAP